MLKRFIAKRILEKRRELMEGVPAAPFLADVGSQYEDVVIRLPSFKKFTKFGRTVFRSLRTDCRKFLIYRRRIQIGSKHQSEIDEFRRNGFVVVPNFIPSNECDELYRKVMSLAQKGLRQGGSELEGGAEVQIRNENDAPDLPDTGMVHILDLVQEIPEVRGIMASSLVQELLSYAGIPSPRFVRYDAYVKSSVVRTERFHADRWDKINVKWFVYLTDVPSLEYGPFAYIRGSHRSILNKYGNIVLNLFIDRYVDFMDVDFVRKKDIVYAIAPKGTLIFADQTGFHRGIPQTPGYERVILVTYIAE